MRQGTFLNIVAADASKDEVGAAVAAAQLFALSAQAVVTGTSSGTLNIQASNDISAPTNWSNIATIGTVTISGAGVFLIPKLDICYNWIRASFVHNNAASGTISVNLQVLGM